MPNLSFQADEEFKERIVGQLRGLDTMSDYMRGAVATRLEGYREGHVYLELDEDLREQVEDAAGDQDVAEWIEELVLKELESGD